MNDYFLYICFLCVRLRVSLPEDDLSRVPLPGPLFPADFPRVLLLPEGLSS